MSQKSDEVPTILPAHERRNENVARVRLFRSGEKESDLHSLNPLLRDCPQMAFEKVKLRSECHDLSNINNIRSLFVATNS